MNRIRFSSVFQWVGLKDAPNTQTLSYDAHMLEKSGIGGILYIDKNGNTSQIGGQLSFAHHLTINDANNQYISFGLSYKFTQFKLDVSNFENPNDDPNIGSDLSSFNSNFDAAFLYEIEHFYFSFTAANILNKSIKVFDEGEPKKLRNYYIYTGYVFELSDGEFEIEPSIYYKLFESDSRSITDLNVKAKKMTDNGYYWAGFSTRFLNDQSFEPLAIVPMLGLKNKQLYVGYAFQYNINEANELNHGGTHMLTLGYDFESNRGSPRW
jgi:type IX secretion system PorP/SprF family membrane protein